MLDQNLLPNNISRDQFQQLLGRYDALIESISSTKGAKPDQKTLLELDRFRYHDLVESFRLDGKNREMTLDDLKLLVEWKLRHGKFRPTLMKLVSSNDETVAKHTIREAIEAYQADSDASKALDRISKLRGIGPATASLLLSVHDPHGVIFFSDEAFYWLCCDGKKPPIKYNAKEYRELSATARALIERIGVDATDVEKVAYVLMKEETSETIPSNDKAAPTTDAKPPTTDSCNEPKKRKTGNVADTTDHQAPLRRSKRGKAS
ncbi:hypothetical protein M426DRAFT_319658 [Hypoxylon sp. CI-4A]|nr:hypothetical protein M426DRAFT_319658 [Hypoxylon sp. CI-4A]